MKSARPAGGGGRGKKGRKGRRGGGDDDGDDELPAEEEVDEEMEEEIPALAAVVKVFTTHSDPDYCLPWQKQPQQRSVGTGFVIAGRPGRKERFVLTNAHCIEYHTQVQLKRRGDDDKFPAKVLAIGWECDLALVAVENPAFFEGLAPVAFARKLPALEDPVMCAGYPVGGETLSVTSGVVSRVEVTEYTQSRTDLLGIQIDAAINSGNSGGPALNEQGQCVGVAFQSMGAAHAENIGYVIPIPVVEHFLRDVADAGCYRGFPSLGLGVQNMESSTLRAAHGMAPRERGVLVRTVDKTGCCHGKVLPGDVLLAFDGQSIGYDATMPLRSHERVLYTWSVAQKYVDEEAEVSVLRGGERRKLQLRLSIPHHLVPNHLPDKQPTPSYFIVGGLVFTPLSIGYMKDQFTDDWSKEAPLPLSYRTCYTRPQSQTQQLVVIAQILAHDLNVGYSDLEHCCVEKVCGEKIGCILDLTRIVRAHTGERIRIDLSNDAGIIIIPRQKAQDALPGMLKEHCIKSDISDDLAALLADEAAAAPPAAGAEAEQSGG